MRILYLADIRFPLDRANGIQTIETCYAVAERGHDVRLLVRPDTASSPRDPFDFYGLDPHPRLHVQRVRVIGIRFAAPDHLRGHGPLWSPQPPGAQQMW